MKSFEKKVEVRWSDLDPNDHLRHSVYYDFGAYSRVSLLNDNGITSELMTQHHIGPILFREECLFKREIRLGDTILINVKLVKCTEDISRWTMLHELWKNTDTLAAIITVDGAWIDTRLRKLVKPPEVFKLAFNNIPRSDSFT